MTEQQKVAAIIVAAGEGKRMGGVDKVFAPLGGEAILMRATRPFQKSALIDQIVVVVSDEHYEKCRHLAGKGEWSKVSEVCIGGRRRQDSVAAGLKKLGDCDWVVIHDGARPLVTVELIERGLEAARETGSAAAAVPVKDTIKVVGGDEIVYETPPRQNLRAVQTPQVFRADIIKEAYKKAKKSVTDDASLVEQAGYEVKLYSGSYDNIKITTPDDLNLAEVILKKYEH
jgi:2-C-methyl-D-erythritol 4-phosphate cytidylyltransferase